MKFSHIRVENKAKTVKLQYRKAEKSDIAKILEQSRALIEQYEDLQSINLDEIMAWMERKTTRFIHEYRKVSLDGVVVAYYRLAEHEGEVELDDFYVLEEYRDKGIGSMIMERILKSISCPIKLYVFNENNGAMRFYTRYGFKLAQWVSTTRCIMVRVSSY